MNISQNSRMRKMPLTDSRNGVLETSADAQGGVGGRAGMKNDGRQATVDCIIANLISIRTTNKASRDQERTYYYRDI